MLKAGKSFIKKQQKRNYIGHVADSVLLGRDSNRDPDRYRANSIHHSNNDNSNNNVDDLTNLGDGSIYLYLYIFLEVVQDAANFKTNSSPLVMY